MKTSRARFRWAGASDSTAAWTRSTMASTKPGWFQYGRTLSTSGGSPPASRTAARARSMSSRYCRHAE